jgi:hypothetical protein
LYRYETVKILDGVDEAADAIAQYEVGLSKLNSLHP